MSLPSDRPAVGVAPGGVAVRRGGFLALALIAVAVPAWAQPAPPPGGSAPRADSGRGAALTARYHVRQMENVLERAVQHAADMMRRRLEAVTPDVLALAGAPRAQGFRIDGYGLFFSVEVPRLSESVNWALKVLSQDSDERVLASLQKVATSEQDPVVRADVERAMRTIQLQLAAMSRVTVSPSAAASRRLASASPAAVTSPGPTAPAPVAAAEASAPVPSGEAAPAAPPVAGASMPTPAPAASPGSPPPAVASMSAAPVVAPPETPSPPAPMGDPSVAYEDEVKQALVDAMLDYAGSLQLPSVEWVTVAARDAGYVAFPDAVSDMVTVTLSVRVADLLDFRAQRLTREEARTRVVVREF